MQTFRSKNRTHSLFIIKQKWSTKYSYNTPKQLLQNLHKKTKSKMKHWINTTIKNNKTKHVKSKKNIKIQNKQKNKEENWKRKNHKRNELELQRKTPNLDLQNEKKEALQATNKKDMNTITTWNTKEHVPQGWKWQCKA